MLIPSSSRGKPYSLTKSPQQGEWGADLPGWTGGWGVQRMGGGGGGGGGLITQTGQLGVGGGGEIERECIQ